MLRNFAAALLATALIASPAFAAQPSDPVGATPATVAAHANGNAQAKPIKMVKHARTHVRKHLARSKVGTMKVASHAKTTKAHRSHVAHVAHAAKSGKVSKNTKSSA